MTKPELYRRLDVAPRVLNFERPHGAVPYKREPIHLDCCARCGSELKRVPSLITVDATVVRPCQCERSLALLAGLLTFAAGAVFALRAAPFIAAVIR